MKKIAFLLFFTASYVFAQQTVSLEEGAISPKANLTQVAWLEGHWQGEAFGGITEEIWSAPLGGSMMFSFKHIAEGKVNFYELGHIRELDETLIYELKHFSGDLKGWEEKDEKVVAKLVKIEGNRAYFDDFTFERLSDDEINIYVVIEGKEKTEEVTFNYKRVVK